MSTRRKSEESKLDFVFSFFYFALYFIHYNYFYWTLVWKCFYNIVKSFRLGYAHIYTKHNYINYYIQRFKYPICNRLISWWLLSRNLLYSPKSKRSLDHHKRDIKCTHNMCDEYQNIVYFVRIILINYT